MTREAIEYFKFQRKIFCEEHLKICPKDSIAYQATLKEKEFYDMAIKALEQEPKIKVLDRDEASRKLGAVDIYKASAWIKLLDDLEYAGMKICEVEE